MGFTVSIIDRRPPLVDTIKPAVSTIALYPLVRIVIGQGIEIGPGGPI